MTAFAPIGVALDDHFEAESLNLNSWGVTGLLRTYMAYKWTVLLVRIAVDGCGRVIAHGGGSGEVWLGRRGRVG